MALAHWWYLLVLEVAVFLLLPALGGLVFSRDWLRSSRVRRWLEWIAAQLWNIVGIFILVGLLAVIAMAFLVYWGYLAP